MERLADLEPGQIAEAQFEERTGMPTHVVIDLMPGAVDDEECYDLSSCAPSP